MSFKAEPGMTATLLEPYRGYTRIELVEFYTPKWMCKIIESGMVIFVYEDEFELD